MDKERRRRDGEMEAEVEERFESLPANFTSLLTIEETEEE